jgi:MFS family permease
LFARHLGAPADLIGLIVAAVTITGIMVKLPSGALSDLFGFRKLMMAGAVVKATGPFAYLAVLSWPVLLASASTTGWPRRCTPRRPRRWWPGPIRTNAVAVWARTARLRTAAWSWGPCSAAPCWPSAPSMPRSSSPG